MKNITQTQTEVWDIPVSKYNLNWIMKNITQTQTHTQSLISILQKGCCLVAKLCLTCDPMDCSPPGSSVHGTSQARMLEWVAISIARGSFQPRDQTHIFCTGRKILYRWATREAPSKGQKCKSKGKKILSQIEGVWGDMTTTCNILG